MESTRDGKDESFLQWRVGIEEDDRHLIDDEEYGSEQLLKTVVRTSYLYHLRQSLRKNLEASKQKNNYAVDEAIVNKVIKGCSALLEEKALRYCMIAKLYQRVMAQTIKEVKKATNECFLFSALKEFAEQQSKVPISSVSHKEAQTDLASLIEKQIAIVETEHTPPKPKRIPTTSTPPPPLVPVPNAHLVNGNQEQYAKTVDHHRLSNGSMCPIFNDIFGDDEEVVTTTTTAAAAAAATAVKMLSARPRPTEPKRRVPIRKKSPNMSFVRPDTNFENKLKRVAFAESVAMWYNLECEIEEMSPTKRQKLEEKYVQLFGEDHAVDYYMLTADQKSIACRKRIAKFVVTELTNFYVQKKIASKQLFKTMAKHITSILLGRSLYPNSEEIKRSVEEFFLDGRVINSEDDFYF